MRQPAAPSPDSRRISLRAHRTLDQARNSEIRASASRVCALPRCGRRRPVPQTPKGMRRSEKKYRRCAELGVLALLALAAAGAAGALGAPSTLSLQQKEQATTRFLQELSELGEWSRRALILLRALPASAACCKLDEAAPCTRCHHPAPRCMQACGLALWRAATRQLTNHIRPRLGRPAMSWACQCPRSCACPSHPTPSS